MKQKDKKQKVENSNEDLVRLGKRMKKLRLEKGYTSYETFAYEHDLPRALYGNWEKGRNITYVNLLKVIRALGITQEEFFSEGFD